MRYEDDKMITTEYHRKPAFVAKTTGLPMYQVTPSMAASIHPEDYPLPDHDRTPICQCNGLGVDSWELTFQMAERGLRPDLITFADVGSEHGWTYAVVEEHMRLLESLGFPPLVIVQLTPPKAGYGTIEENMLANETLPSLAFGGKSCSLRWKKEPQDMW
jgi:hypothetical protein